MHAIEIQNLTKFFNTRKVLDNLSLNIEKGQTCVIIGRSGCGKSVLLKHIEGILKPDSGKIIINGQDITKLTNNEMDKIRLKMGMVFQGGALFDSMTVGENVGFNLIEHNHVSNKELLEKGESALCVV